MKAPDYNTQQHNNSFKKLNEAVEALRQKYRVTKKLEKEDLAVFRNAKVGDVITHNPEIPDNPVEAFELFTNYYATLQCELQKNLFFDKYRVWNEVSIKTEIEDLDKWIDEANKISYTDVLKSSNTHIWEHEYLKLVNGYYKGYLMTWEQHNENSTTASVYGKYVLFHDFLENELREIENTRQSEIKEVLQRRTPDYLKFIESGIEELLDKTYKDRKQIFGDVSLKEHCEKELVFQNKTLATDIDKSLNHKDFELRMIYHAVADKRKDFIDFLTKKIEDLSFPDIPFIGELINKNINISAVVLDNYYGLVPQPSNDNKLPDNYAGKHHRYNEPYRLKVYGAFVLSKDWELLTLQRQQKLPPYNSISEKLVEDALGDYAYGFKKGYFNFERDLLDEGNAAIVIKNPNCAKVVFDYVTGVLSGRGGFPITFGEDNYFKEWHIAGIEAGRYYRAWYIILDYYFVFEPLFFNYNKSTISSENIPETNDFTLSTIEDYLEVFYQTKAISLKDYNTIKEIFFSYFKNAVIQKIKTPVFVRNGNKKKLAYALGEIYRSLKNVPLSYEYLTLLANTFNVFSNEKIEKDKVNKCNLYKYCTNKT